MSATNTGQPTKQGEADALAAVFRADFDEARRRVRELNYAEAYLLRIACEQLILITAERMRQIGRGSR